MFSEQFDNDSLAGFVNSFVKLFPKLVATHRAGIDLSLERSFEASKTNVVAAG